MMIQRCASTCAAVQLPGRPFVALEARVGALRLADARSTVGVVVVGPSDSSGRVSVGEPVQDIFPTGVFLQGRLCPPGDEDTVLCVSAAGIPAGGAACAIEIGDAGSSILPAGVF